MDQHQSVYEYENSHALHNIEQHPSEVDEDHKVSSEKTKNPSLKSNFSQDMQPARNGGYHDNLGNGFLCYLVSSGNIYCLHWSLYLYQSIYYLGDARPGEQK